MRTEFGFNRTHCDCRKCQIWCEHQPGALVPSDLDRLLPAGADPYKWASIHLRASMGSQWFVGSAVIVIPSLVPAKDDSGACHWYQNGRCSVHDDAPYGCAFLDQHFTREQGNQRNRASGYARWQAFEQEGLYAKVWEYLWEKGYRYTTTVEDREQVIAIFRRMDLAAAREKRQAAEGKLKRKRKLAQKQRRKQRR